MSGYKSHCRAPQQPPSPRCCHLGCTRLPRPRRCPPLLLICLLFMAGGTEPPPAPHSPRGPSPQPQKVEFNAGGFASQEFLRPHNAQLGFEKASGLKCNRKLDKPAQGPQTMGCSSLLSFTACEGPARRVTSHALEMLLAWTPAGRAPLCGSRSGEQPERQAEQRDISARSRG